MLNVPPLPKCRINKTVTFKMECLPIQWDYAAVSKAHALRSIDSPAEEKKTKVLLEGSAQLKGPSPEISAISIPLMGSIATL